MINAHGHVADTQGLRTGEQFYTEENLLRQLGLYARYGVTTVFSLGGDREAGFKLRREQETPALARACTSQERSLPARLPRKRGRR